MTDDSPSSKFLTEIPEGFRPYKTPKSFINDLVKEAKKHEPKCVDDFGQAIMVNLNGKKKDTNENLIIAPYSIQHALQMAAAGSNNTTFSEFMKTLQIPNVGSVDGLLKNQGMLASEKKKKPVFTAAFSMWINSKFDVYKSYVDSIKNAFNASIFVLDFSSSQTTDEINSWVSRQTKKMINSVVDEVKKEDSSFLINTLYFKGKWEEEFKVDATTTGNFTRADRSVQQAMLMHATQKLDYFSDEYVQAVVFPFDKELNLLVLLPKNTGPIALDMVAKRYLVSDRISHILFNVINRNVRIELPRFNVSYSTSLKDTLTQLGLVSAFSDNADFSFISPQKIKITDVLHKVAFNVNEVGAQFAAATSIGIEKTTAKLPKRDDSLPFIADRPFVFALLDDKITLFTGIVRDLGTEIVAPPPKINTKEL